MQRTWNYSGNDGKPLKGLSEKSNVIRLNFESFLPAADCEINYRAAKQKWVRPTKGPPRESRKEMRVDGSAGRMELLEASVQGVFL